ncbi:MAG: FkbM family methyltransferase [Betaproteobacteria bacterium]
MSTHPLSHHDALKNISAKRSFSFEGSDLIIASLLRNVAQGTYIDVGANHPIANNNTYHFYEKGWRGLAIDGNAEFENDWAHSRPKDQFKNALVSNVVKDVEFLIFPDHTLSTIDSNAIARYSSRFPDQSIVKEIRQTTTLFDLNNQYLKDLEIHLLSIDIEGEEINCLEGANLKEWHPGVIVIETKHLSSYQVLDNDIVQYLTQLGYRMIAKTPLDAFFVFPSKPYLEWIPKTIL